jgi:hypothetical protein
VLPRVIAAPELIRVGSFSRFGFAVGTAVIPAPASMARQSIDPLTREAIAAAPEFTNWTPFAVVVDARLVKATDDAICHGNDRTPCFSVDSKISRATPASARMSPCSTFQSRNSATSAFSNDTIATATLVGWFRFGR